jgi:hypothetical protein
MTIDECQSAYLALSSRIFNPKRAKINTLGRGKDFLLADGKFDTKELEDSIKDLLKARGFSSETLLQDPDPICKVYVIQHIFQASTVFNFVLVSCAHFGQETPRLQY